MKLNSLAASALQVADPLIILSDTLPPLGRSISILSLARQMVILKVRMVTSLLLPPSRTSIG